MTFYDLNKYYDADHQDNSNRYCGQILALNIAVVPGRKLFHSSDAFQPIPGNQEVGLVQ